MRKKTCFLHVGMPKTGSSAVQYALTKAAPDLREQGYLYPDLSGTFNIVLSGIPTAGNGSKMAAFLKQGALDKAFRYLDRCSNWDGHLIISSEFLCSPRLPIIELGKEIRARGFLTKAIVFIRPQVDRLLSFFLQKVKAGEIETSLEEFNVSLERFVEEMLTCKEEDHLEIIRVLETAYQDVTVKWYPAVVRDGRDAAAQAVWSWLGARVLPPPVPLINPTPGTIALRQLLAEKPKRRTADRLLALAAQKGELGEKIQLPLHLAKRVHKTFYESNLKVFERYFPDLSPEVELRLSTGID